MMNVSLSIILSKPFSIVVLSMILAVLAVLFAIFLLTVKTKNRIGSYFLAFYFLIMAFDFSAYYGPTLVDIPVWLSILRNDIASFLAMPFIYLYALSVIHAHFVLKPQHLLHASSFILVTLISIPWYFPDAFAPSAYRNSLDHTTGLFVMHFCHIHTQFYIVALFVTLRNHKQILLANYSDVHISNYKWLLQMTFMLQLFLAFIFIKNMFRWFSKDYHDIDAARVVLLVFTILFLCWLLLKALHAPVIFRGVPTGPKETKSKKTPLSQLEQQAEMLKQYMLEKEPFLNPELTIQELAHQTQMPVREISELINQYFNQHFYDFVNTYRINKAKKLIKSNNSKSFTISEIIYLVGFNSKSSFYTVFKKQVGCTPKQYRKKSNSPLFS